MIDVKLGALVSGIGSYNCRYSSSGADNGEYQSTHEDGLDQAITKWAAYSYQLRMKLSQVQEMSII